MPPCKVDGVIQLASRCGSNRFKLDAGVKLIRIVMVGSTPAMFSSVRESTESAHAPGSWLLLHRRFSFAA
jgi:hypothetical protein